MEEGQGWAKAELLLYLKQSMRKDVGWGHPHLPKFHREKIYVTIRNIVETLKE